MDQDHPSALLETMAGERASDRVENELSKLILSLELAPGSIQQESALMARLGCGRTPLREALQRLSRDGLLEMRPRQGIHILPLNISDFFETMEAMAEIEPAVGRLAAGRITPAELAELDAILGRFAQLLDQPTELFEVDFEFHALIARACRNRLLEEADLRLHRFAHRFALISWHSPERSQAGLDYHRQILAALAAADGKSAYTLLFDHIQITKERTLEGFEEYRRRAPRGKPALA